MAWLSLIVAGVFETIWMICLKQSNGFKNLAPTAGFVVTSLISFFLLAHALKHIPLGSSYAVWTGVGIIGTVIVGIFWYKDPATPIRLLCILIIAVGIFGLMLFEKN